MAALTTLITGLLAIVQLFITAASDFLIPQYDTTTSTYNVTLIHIAIWAPVLLGMNGAGANLLFSFFRKRSARRG